MTRRPMSPWATLAVALVVGAAFWAGVAVTITHLIG